MALADAQVTAKCVEVSKSLVNKQTGFHFVDLDATRITGDVARLAANIRQQGRLDIAKIQGISVPLKLDYALVKSGLLPTLERLGWGEVAREGSRIVGFEERIPPLADVLVTLGKEWRDGDTTEVDVATVNSIGLLSQRPMTEPALQSELSVKDAAFKKTIQYGLQTNYFGSFKSKQTGESVVWTPHYWTSRRDDVQKYLARQDEAAFSGLSTLTKELESFPGRPLERLGKHPPSLINGGIANGYFPASAVRDRSGKEHLYAFAPTANFEPDPSKDIFEKARVIVSSLRHGQFHAEVTPIRMPGALLKRLVDGSLKPHSYAEVEYAPIISHRICTFERVTTSFGKATKLNFLDTPENRVAVNIAEAMLAGGEPAAAAAVDPAATALVAKGMYGYSAEQLQIKTATEVAAKDEFSQLMELLQGGIRR